METYSKLSSIYDKLIYEDINYNNFYDKIMDMCKKYDVKFNNYLDLACGTGNLSEIICKHFKNTYLVDLSEEMLMVAADKLRNQKINAKVICQDMSELVLNNKFDLITCCMDSTNYLTEDEDIEKYFLSVYNHLENDGIFIFDINSYYKLSEILGNNTFTYDEEDVFYVWENIFEDDILEMDLTFFVKEGDLYQRFDEQHIERAYKEEYIENILKATGFNILNKLDNYDENIIKDTTERITYVVKK